jgi:hypothetical protein
MGEVETVIAPDVTCQSLVQGSIFGLLYVPIQFPKTLVLIGGTFPDVTGLGVQGVGVFTFVDILSQKFGVQGVLILSARTTVGHRRPVQIVPVRGIFPKQLCQFIPELVVISEWQVPPGVLPLRSQYNIVTRFTLLGENLVQEAYNLLHEILLSRKEGVDLSAYPLHPVLSDSGEITPYRRPPEP